MKIALIASAYIPVPPPKYGGTELVIHNIRMELEKLGHEVTLFATGDSIDNGDLFPICQNALPFARTELLDTPLKPLRESAHRVAIDFIKENPRKFDVVHSHGIDVSEVHHLVPSVVTLHGAYSDKNEQLYNRFPELNYIAISEDQKTRYPNIKIIDVVYNGIDLRSIPFNSKSNRSLCFIGRLDGEKRPHIAVQTAIDLNIPITVAGKVDHAGVEYYHNELEPLLTHPLVSFLGEVTPQKAYEIFYDSGVNLHPISLGFPEPFGLSVLQSLVSGTPTVCTSIGSMSELIFDRLTGYRVNTFINNRKQISEYIEKCFKMDRRLISLIARRRFNSRNMAMGYVQAYQKAIDLFHSH
jgi:glycosyltransferase involved in cell wall biosynthesis